MVDIQERQEQRFQLLKRLFVKSDGNTSAIYDIYDIGAELGLDKQNVNRALAYLTQEGLVKTSLGSSSVRISHQGAKEIERALTAPNEPTTYFPAVINMSGDFHGSVVNVASTLTSVSKSISASPGMDADTKQELGRLVEQLEHALQAVPPEKIKEAEAVAWAAESLVEATVEERPNKYKVEITKEGLIKAAANIAAVTPSVLVIAKEIVQFIQNIIPN